MKNELFTHFLSFGLGVLTKLIADLLSERRLVAQKRRKDQSILKAAEKRNPQFIAKLRKFASDGKSVYFVVLPAKGVCYNSGPEVPNFIYQDECDGVFREARALQDHDWLIDETTSREVPRFKMRENFLNLLCNRHQ